MEVDVTGWGQLLSQFGIPTVIILAMAWVAVKFGQPLTLRWMDRRDKDGENSREFQIETIKSVAVIAAALEHISGKLDSHSLKLDQIIQLQLQLQKDQDSP